MDSTGNHELLVAAQPSRIHGLGMVACQGIPAGARVMEYTGERITKAESVRRCQQGHHFIFALDEEHDLDGGVTENPARWLNHSCAPNCEVIRDGARLWIVAIRNIAVGEELTFNYGYDLVDYREHPCHCRAVGCVGYIVAEEFFEHVRKQSLRTLL